MSEHLATLTEYQPLFTAIGSGLLVLTLIFTAVAAIAAARAAKAAELSVEAASKTAEIQLRAYMLPANPTVQLGGNGIATVSVMLENAGQTPAHQFNMWVDASVLGHPYRGQIITVPPPSHSLSQVSIRSGGVATIHHTVSISREDQALIARAQKAIDVSGYGTYTDVFGKNRITKFRFMYFGAWDGNQSLSACPEGNEAD